MNQFSKHFSDVPIIFCVFTVEHFGRSILQPSPGVISTIKKIFAQENQRLTKILTNIPTGTGLFLIILSTPTRGGVPPNINFDIQRKPLCHDF